MSYLLTILTDEGELFHVVSGVAHGLYFVLSGLLTDIRLFSVHLFKEMKYSKLIFSKTQGTGTRLRLRTSTPPPPPLSTAKAGRNHLNE
jgi:hypothetical protein